MVTEEVVILTVELVLVEVLTEFEDTAVADLCIRFFFCY